MTVFLLAMGPGGEEHLTQIARQAIAESSVLLGAHRLLQPYGHKDCHPLIKPQEIVDTLKTLSVPQVAILLSGDVGFYSGAKNLIPLLEDYTLTLVPGVSSLQYFCSRCQIPWQDCHLVSAHGRSHNALGEIQSHPKTFLLTGQNFGPRDLITKMMEGGLDQVTLTIGENLSYQEETITTATAQAFAQDPALREKTFASLSVVLAENPRPLLPELALRSLPDSAFSRGKVPMTKEELRLLVVSRLSIAPHHLLWDVGAGTGSVSVAMARSAYAGQVFALEQKPEGVALITENKEKFAQTNLHPVLGKAPEDLAHFPPPDGVFVGGSGGNLREILTLALEKNPQVRLVVTAVTLETLAEITALVNTLPLTQVDLCQISVTRTRIAGSYHLMDAQNPVWILSAQGAETVKTEAPEEPPEREGG